MAANTKRSWQLQEFMAHGANVNCLALGHKSGRVLVTGGDDKKVNLWAIGKENCIMSLSGHLTPVECVKFAHTEDMVCAGSQAGALKQWDLEAAKLFRTLTGHKAGIKCIDFHPYGDFLASGSLDTSIKLWDYRKKACIFTYKGHDETVNSIKFSPDGQWIASGGEEGKVKIWDLRAGRVLKELDEHSGAITDVEFHPQEFLLVSSSADRSVSFWDLENFQLVSKTEKETALIRCLQFSVDGQCLFGGCPEQLKVYGWEPARIFDTVTTGWGKVQDMAIARDQLIGASFNLTRVLVCVVDINKVSRTAPPTSKTSQVSTFSHGQTVRKSFNKQKPRPTKAVQVKPIDEEYDTDDAANSFIPNVNDYEAVFKPHRSLNRSPPPPDTDHIFKLPSLCRSPPPNPFSESTSEDDSASSIPVSISTKRAVTTYHDDAEQSQIPVPVKLPERNVPSPLMVKASIQQSPITSSTTTQATKTNGHLTLSKYTSNREMLRRVNSCKADTATQSNNIPVNNTENQFNRSESSLPDVVSRHKKATDSHRRDIPKNSERYSSQTSVPYGDNEPQDNEIIPSMTNGPVDLRLEEFLPASYRNGGAKSQQPHSNVSEEEVISSLTRNHEMVLTILKIRQRNLEIIYSLWHNQDLKCAIEGAVSMNDQAVLIDVLLAINKRPSLWNLDICVVLLPAIYDILHSKYEMYMAVCCESLHLILKNFSSVIKTNVQWSSPTIGVDISKEERYAKCVKCYENLIAIRTFLLKRQTMQGKLGQSFRELQSMLYAIEK